ncbi:hypothetical protein [Micromonospora sp. DT47]|uniref:hypothetical protein n=1 Tax=Micromonospora sp. DT47 TaxID=3393431 RepID=UPI003CF6292E
MEPSCAEAVGTVIGNPDWLDLRDQRIVVLGAGAEMGPLTSVLRWGGEVVAVDLPRPEIWRRVLRTARRHGGRLHLPLRPGAGADADDQTLASSAGADLLHRLPQVADWLHGIDGRLVLGNYVYADGATNVRVAVAVDALTRHLQERRDDVALAFLATPTDVFAVPAEAVGHAEQGYARRGVARRALRVLSAGRLLHRNYPPGADPGINDSLVPQQGPNYALAKRLQRWRATVAREAGADGVVQRRTADPYAVGAAQPGARGRVRRRAPVRHRGVRPGHQQHPDGRAAGAQPAHRRPEVRAAVAGRGVRRGARRAVAGAVRPAQRARARRPARPRRCPRLSLVRADAAPAGCWDISA